MLDILGFIWANKENINKILKQEQEQDKLNEE